MTSTKKDLHIVHFGLDRVASSADSAILLSHAAGLGPSLALLESPAWIAIGFGLFGDNGPSVRFSVAHSDKTALHKKVAGPLTDFLRTRTQNAEFSDLQERPNWQSWLQDVSSQKHGFECVDLYGPVPRFVASEATANALWMAQFLEQVASSGVERAGTVIMLRPLTRVADGSPDRSVALGLSRRIENLPQQKVCREASETTSVGTSSSTSQETEKAGGYKLERKAKGSEAKDAYEREGKTHGNVNQEQKARNSETTTEVSAWPQDEARERALTLLGECQRAGGWWARIRCFGSDVAVARRAAAMYWSSLSTVPQGHQLGARLEGYAVTGCRSVARDEGSNSWNWDVLSSTESCETVEEQRNGQLDAVVDSVETSFRRNGLGVLFKDAETEPDGARRREHNRLVLKKACGPMILPLASDMLWSGHRLSSAFQLPVDPNPLVEVVKGFDYCAVPKRDPLKTAGLRIGTCCIGGVSSEKTGNIEATILDSWLTRHTLVVGATGSGKTTTVLSLLAAAKENRKVRVTILEGAKREYRNFRSRIGVEESGHFDLVNRFPVLNIFEHPASVSPEAHVSQISALFDSTLELPPPVPMLMQQALKRAYSAYHAETDPVLKRQHPILYWLLRATMSVQQEAGYKGEIEGNINGILRTRLRALAAGAAGKVFGAESVRVGDGAKAKTGGSSRADDVGASWKRLSDALAGSSSLIELESIADRCTRALVMSLFVLYFRYALEERSQGAKSNEVRNLLVLEEAHRIIGRPSSSDSGPGALEYFGHMLGEIRAYGCGIIVSDQSPSRLIDDAMRNTNTKFIMRLVSGEDIRASVVGAGLPEAASRDIPLLKQGYAILVAPEQLPVLVQVKRVDEDSVAQETRPMSLIAMSAEGLSAARQQLRFDDAATDAAFAYWPPLAGAKAWKAGELETIPTPLRNAIAPLLELTGTRSLETALAVAHTKAGCACVRVDGDSICGAHRKRVLEWLLPVALGAMG